MLCLGDAVEKRSWSVRQVLDWTRKYLRQAGVEAARFEAEILLAHALGTERLELYLNPERGVNEQERARFKRLLTKRTQGVPLQYLIGTVDFMGCEICVNEAVLVPRFETEELVEKILQDVPSELALSILELGTGSGAIAIALAKHLKHAKIVATEISVEALEIAQKNAERNGVSNRIAFLQSDWFSEVSGSFDLIVSNPPYVDSKRLRTLPKEVKHEPRIALDGGEAGLQAIRTIIEGAPAHLKQNSRLYLEIGETQAEKVAELTRATGAFSTIEILRDSAGKDRFLRAVRAYNYVPNGASLRA